MWTKTVTDRWMYDVDLVASQEQGLGPTRRFKVSPGGTERVHESPSIAISGCGVYLRTRRCEPVT